MKFRSTFFFLLFFFSVETAVDITSCQNITSSGEYYLINNLTNNQSSGACIHVLANNTIINLNGYSITGINQSSTYGIQIMQNVINTTILNGTINHYSSNILLTRDNNFTTIKDLNLSTADLTNFFSINIQNRSMSFFIENINSTIPASNQAYHIRVINSSGLIDKISLYNGRIGVYYEGTISRLKDNILNNSLLNLVGVQIYTNSNDTDRLKIENTIFKGGGSSVRNRFQSVNVFNCTIEQTINYGGSVGSYTVANSTFNVVGTPSFYTGGINVLYLNNRGNISYFTINYITSNFTFLGNNFSTDSVSMSSCEFYPDSVVNMINNTFNGVTFFGSVLCGVNSTFIGNNISKGNVRIISNNSVVANNLIDGKGSNYNGLTIGGQEYPKYRPISNISVYNNTVFGFNRTGVNITWVNNCIFHSNKIYRNNITQLLLLNTSNITFYNNIFNATGTTFNSVFNVSNVRYINFWNTTKTLGTNIIGGPYIGGNWYSNYTNWDTDGDGIGEDIYILNENNTDYLPLTYNTDATPPSIQFEDPTPGDYSAISGNWININVTANDTNLKNITIFLFNSTGSLINFTTCFSSPCYSNFTSLDYGEYYYNATAVDIVNWQNSTETRKIILDAQPPAIDFEHPTAENNSTIESNYILINVSASDTNLKNITIFLFNSTGSLINSTSKDTLETNDNLFVNYTNLNPGMYQYNATAFDWAGNFNFTETRILHLTFSDFYRISECRVLNQSGRYTLNQSIFGTLPYNICLYIVSDNVEINFSEYQLIGEGEGWGVYSLGFKNITLTNPKIKNYTNDVFFSFLDNPSETLSIRRIREIHEEKEDNLFIGTLFGFAIAFLIFFLKNKIRRRT